MELPENTEELILWPDVNAHLMTLERDDNGCVYLVSWAYGNSKVWAKILPSGSVEIATEEE